MPDPGHLPLNKPKFRPQGNLHVCSSSTAWLLCLLALCSDLTPHLDGFGGQRRDGIFVPLS